MQIQWKLDRKGREILRKASVEKNGLGVRFTIEEGNQAFTLTLKELTYLVDLAEKYKQQLKGKYEPENDPSNI